LRSYNKSMPEEINRIVADHCSTLNLCPNALAVENLQKEGIITQVYIVGDIMYDMFHTFLKIAHTSTVLHQHRLNSGEYMLCTIHRPENTDDRIILKNIFTALGSCTYPVALPLHPRTRKKMELFSIRPPKNVHILPPLGYLDMLCLEVNALKIFTDSGGVQKEAAWAGKPCLVLRNESEWKELLDLGYAVLVQKNIKEITTKINLDYPPLQTLQQKFAKDAIIQRICSHES